MTTPIPDPNAEEALEMATIERLLELGWDAWADCYPETAEDCSISGRESRDQVVLPGRLRRELDVSRIEVPGTSNGSTFERVDAEVPGTLPSADAQAPGP